MVLVAAMIAVIVVAAALCGQVRDGGPLDGPAVTWTASPTPTVSAAGSGEFAAARAALAVLPVIGWDRAQDFRRYRFGEAWSDEVNVEFGRNGCNTRDDILRRDLTGLVVRPGTCFAESGVLHDPYTGATVEFRRGPDTSGDVQIDHVVSLSDAWYKGARDWDDQRRRDFANDPRNLLAVSPRANFDKAFRDAASWLPPDESYPCEFVARQVEVKTLYELSVSGKEKAAMADVLKVC